MVAVEGLSRIPGGASRETYRFDAVHADGARRGMILRRDPVGSLIDTDRRLEFLAYQSFHGGIPVPEPIALEGGRGAGAALLPDERVDGGQRRLPFAADPYAPHAERIGEASSSPPGPHRRDADPADLPITPRRRAPARRAAGATRWTNGSGDDRQRRAPSPAHRPRRDPAALRATRRRRRSSISVVHGDYRSGNFLHDGAGGILALLDWEMAHLGDPLEDLAWAFDPLWGHGDENRVAGLLTPTTAVAVWERASGLAVDPAAFAWWRLFAR